MRCQRSTADDGSGDGTSAPRAPRAPHPRTPRGIQAFTCSPLACAEVKVDAKRGKKKKAKKKDVWSASAREKCKSLQEIIDEAEYQKYPSWVPNYSSIAAAPSRYPPRRFCSVSGLVGKYKCPVTGDYLATLDAYTTHRETRLKGLI